MERRDFVEACALGASGALALMTQAAWAAQVRPRSYERLVLVDELGQPLRASTLKPKTNYVFHYPFESTPVFLLDLGKRTTPLVLETRDKSRYTWPGGVGARSSIVAFSAICAHKLVYPTRELSFISFRKGAAVNPQTPSKGNDLIHCCADHSQYDPAKGAQVLSGPADQPLCAILLEHDARQDTLTATGTLGGELFEEFFRKYEMKLSLEVGPRARQVVSGQGVVRELERFCRNPVRC